MSKILNKVFPHTLLINQKDKFTVQKPVRHHPNQANSFNGSDNGTNHYCAPMHFCQTAVKNAHPQTSDKPKLRSFLHNAVKYKITPWGHISTKSRNSKGHMIQFLQQINSIKDRGTILEEKKFKRDHQCNSWILFQVLISTR